MTAAFIFTSSLLLVVATEHSIVLVHNQPTNQSAQHQQQHIITMDFAFGPPPTSTTSIGNDILDIGSRKAQARRQRGAGLIGGDLMSPAPITMGMPGQFDLPNVDNVSF